ncbi:MAG: hypothetical protein ACI4GC_02195 [Acutalibacteraceae bacterium]
MKKIKYFSIALTVILMFSLLGITASAEAFERDDILAIEIPDGYTLVDTEFPVSDDKYDYQLLGLWKNDKGSALRITTCINEEGYAIFEDYEYDEYDLSELNYSNALNSYFGFEVTSILDGLSEVNGSKCYKTVTTAKNDFDGSDVVSVYYTFYTEKDEIVVNLFSKGTSIAPELVSAMESLTIFDEILIEKSGDDYNNDYYGEYSDDYEDYYEDEIEKYFEEVFNSPESAMAIGFVVIYFAALAFAGIGLAVFVIVLACNRKKKEKKNEQMLLDMFAKMNTAPFNSFSEEVKNEDEQASDE